MKVYLTNAFAENMKKDKSLCVLSRSLTEQDMRDIILNGNYSSGIGHQGLIDYLNTTFGGDIPYQRNNIRVGIDDVIIHTYLSQRLPENPTVHNYNKNLNYCMKWFKNPTSEDIMLGEEKLETIKKGGI